MFKTDKYRFILISIVLNDVECHFLALRQWSVFFKTDSVCQHLTLFHESDYGNF